MNLPSLDLLSLFFKLLPGFLAAAFHALTPYPRRDILDRIVAALIFTLFAELGVAAVKPVLIWVGAHIIAIGPWTPRSELACAALAGLSLGVLWAHAVNKGYTHSLLRRTGTTKRTSLPSQWFSAFSQLDRYVILHFKDGRRLMGWPLEWPDEPESGHFLLERPGWVLPDGTKMAMHQIEALLVSAKDVEAVEFLRFADDPTIVVNSEAIKSVKQLLGEMHKGPEDEQRLVPAD